MDSRAHDSRELRNSPDCISGERCVVVIREVDLCGVHHMGVCSINMMFVYVCVFVCCICATNTHSVEPFVFIVTVLLVVPSDRRDWRHHTHTRALVAHKGPLACTRRVTPLVVVVFDFPKARAC